MIEGPRVALVGDRLHRCGAGRKGPAPRVVLDVPAETADAFLLANDASDDPHGSAPPEEAS